METSVAEPRDNVVAFPDLSLRAALVTSDRVSIAAMALADVAGLDWCDLTPQRMQIFRELALMAGLFASDTDTAHLIGYFSEHARRAGEYRHGRLEDLDPTTRVADVKRAVGGLQWAATCVFGMDLDAMQRLRQLRDADLEATAGAWKGCR